MLLLNHPTAAAAANAALFPRHQRSDLSPDLSLPLRSFPSGSGLSSSRLLPPLTTSGNPVSRCITRAFPWSPRKNEIVEYEKRPKEKWIRYFEKLAAVRNPEKGVAAVLNGYESKGKRVNTIYLFRAARMLCKAKLYKHALEVYRWMESKPPDTYPVTTKDRAFKLDLIYQAHGASSAEDYFMSLKESVRDRLVHGALLKVYVDCKMKEKAESLYATMKEKGMVDSALFTNAMMTLYTGLGEFDKVDPIISEMKKKGFSLDACSYNIWLTSLGARRSFEKMDQVFDSMKKKPSIDIGWDTYSIMAAVYIKMGYFESAEECLKQVEGKIDGQNRTPYDHLISLYGALGKPRDVHRLWIDYKSKFTTLSDKDYREVIKSLLRCGDVEGAEVIYDEWLSTKPTPYDPRIGNLLLACYVKNGETEKIKAFFNQMAELGGNQNPKTWEILAAHEIRGKRVAEALSCLKVAVSVNQSKKWKPERALVSSILKSCEEEGDAANKEMLFEVLKETGYLHDEMEKGAENGEGIQSA
ncbi:unnamed protein product [Cuscuta campestris]|uniref:Pentacotripeptide-repeat region of PRORP domain-containing protein n=1 Tax=Cuscuta campestris TaxID=132261 RepID=A0A484LH75_9ASTE|nr:unnamed protein product [Cuscuta campestris]